MKYQVFSQKATEKTEEARSELALRESVFLIPESWSLCIPVAVQWWQTLTLGKMLLG
jgi:hypothetical protein